MSSQDLILFSGAIRKRQKIDEATDKAIRLAIGRAAIHARNDILRTVARKTGAMRTDYARGVRELVQSMTPDYKLSFDDFMFFVTTGDTDYIKYHIIEHPDFNIHYNPSIYVDPTTDGTRPILLIEFWDKFDKYIDLYLPREMALQGFTIS